MNDFFLFHGSTFMAKVNFFSKEGQKSKLRFRGQKIWHQQKGLSSRNTHLQYECSVSFRSKIMTKVQFFNGRSKFKTKVMRSNDLVPTESNTTMNTCGKWMPYPCGSKVILNILFSFIFQKWVKNQDQGHRLTSFNTNKNLLPQGIYMYIMNALLI